MITSPNARTMNRVEFEPVADPGTVYVKIHNDKGKHDGGVLIQAQPSGLWYHHVNGYRLSGYDRLSYAQHCARKWWGDYR